MVQEAWIWCLLHNMLQSLFLQSRRGWRKLFTAITAHPFLQACFNKALSRWEDFAQICLIFWMRQHYKHLGYSQLNPSKKSSLFWCWRSHLSTLILKKNHKRTWPVSPFGYIPDLLCTRERSNLFPLVFSSPFLPSNTWLKIIICICHLLHYLTTDFCLTSSVNMVRMCC